MSPLNLRPYVAIQMRLLLLLLLLLLYVNIYSRSFLLTVTPLSDYDKNYSNWRDGNKHTVVCH